MTYKLTILDVAREELFEATEWYEKIQPELAQDLARQFQKTLNELHAKPLLSQKLKNNYRKVNLNRFPYKIVFKIIDREIVVIAVAHHSRKANYWKKRL